MSLLTSGPHKVTVFPAHMYDDGMGRTVHVPVDEDAGIPVYNVMVQPSTHTDTEQGPGKIGISACRVIGAGVWPGGPHARVRVDVGPPDVQGRMYDQRGEPRVYDVSPSTAHFKAWIEARDGKADG